MDGQGLDGDQESHSAQALQRLSELVRRVNSSTDTTQVLREIASGVHDVLGWGVAAISQLDGDHLQIVAAAGPEDVRSHLLGLRAPAASILDEFRAADHWGILRYVPHGRMDVDEVEAAWMPDFEPSDEPGSWHPEDALYAPLYSATGELLGNMSVDLPPDLRVPGQAERELLEMYIVQAGLALSNAQQRERLARQVQLGETLKEVAQAGSRLGLDEMLDAATEVIARGFGGVRTWIRCWPDGVRDRGAMSGHQLVPDRSFAGIERLRQDVASTLWPAGSMVQVSSSDTESALLPTSLSVVQRVMHDAEVTHAVIAPIGVGPELYGYLAVGRQDGRPGFVLDELAAISELARELGRMVHSSRLFETEQRLVSELRELDRYKGELIATISHELKTPLTTIIGHVELLEEHSDPDSSEGRSVNAIRRSADRLDRLIQNLLDYAQVQERRRAVRRNVDVGPLVDSAIDLLSQQAESGGVQVAFSRPDHPVLVSGDPDEIATVLNNLISNAVKYTHRDGRVAVEVDADEDWIRVTVADTGIGISDVDRGHLFSTFHRSSNPEALSLPGTGLGLAISQRIAETHGGRIEVESALGRGSTFRLLLPSNTVPAPCPSPEPAPVDSAVPSAAQLS